MMVPFSPILQPVHLGGFVDRGFAGRGASFANQHGKSINQHARPHSFLKPVGPSYFIKCSHDDSFVGHHGNSISHHGSFVKHLANIVNDGASYESHGGSFVKDHANIVKHRQSYKGHHANIINHRASYESHGGSFVKHHANIVKHYASYKSHHTNIINDGGGFANQQGKSINRHARPHSFLKPVGSSHFIKCAHDDGFVGHHGVLFIIVDKNESHYASSMSHHGKIMEHFPPLLQLGTYRRFCRKGFAGRGGGFANQQGKSINRHARPHRFQKPVGPSDIN